MADSNAAAASALSWLECALARPMANRHEALSLIVHALLINHGFRLASQPYTEAPNDQIYDLPDDWGQAGYGGNYKHARSAMNFEIRAVPLGNKLLVNAMAVEDQRKVYTLQLNVDDYVRKDANLAVTPVRTAASPSASPPPAAAGTAAGATAAAKHTSTTPQDAPPPTTTPPSPPVGLEAVFQNLPTLALDLQTNIIFQLVPESAKDGYERARTEAGGSAARTGRDERNDPLSIPQRVPPRPVDPRMYPGYDDDDEYNGYRPGFRGPPTIGDDDLLPAGLPRGLGGIPGPAPFLPGGNLMGPRHPGWGIRPPGGGGYGGGSAPDIGGIGPRLPRGAVPPGARFDPFGPPPPPDYPRNPRPPPSQFNPDNDIDFPPPGSGDMFM